MGRKKPEVTPAIRDRIRELRRVPAKELLPNPRNYRRHPREQASALQGILAEVGYADALLARETPDGLMLIDGHLRAETTPDQDVPVLVLDVTEAEAEKILLTLDPLAGLATVDKENLRSLMDSVKFSSDELAAALRPLWPGRPELPELKDPPAQIDRAVELKAKWGTTAGQLWQIGDHRILCGDCRLAPDVARLWADGGPKQRMVWTDPPYGVDYAAKNAYFNRSDRGN